MDFRPYEGMMAIDVKRYRQHMSKSLHLSDQSSEQSDQLNGPRSMVQKYVFACRTPRLRHLAGLCGNDIFLSH